MTIYRISVEQYNSVTHDVVIEATDDATVSDLRSELTRLGFTRGDLLINGARVSKRIALANSPLQNGAYLTTRRIPSRPSTGWFLVAIAGPDTGAWISVADAEISVGSSSSADFVINDTDLDDNHFSIRPLENKVEIEAHASCQVQFEGVQITSCVADSGAYFTAGNTIFCLRYINPSETSLLPDATGPALPFQRRFRDAVTPLPKSLKHPTPPSDRSAGTKRSILTYIIPLITTAGFALMIGFTSGGNMSRRLMIMAPIMALGPLLILVDNLRRKRAEKKEQAKRQAEYEDRRIAFLARLKTTRIRERDRDRWERIPTGISALFVTVNHMRLWERSSFNDDFCDVAIGLHEDRSKIAVEGRPDNVTFDMDTHWSAVLRHSLIREGSLSLVGPAVRTRAVARAIILELAVSHSPNDVKIWLISGGDDAAERDWNVLRWLPHTFVGASQNYIFSEPAARAAALSMLRSIINERKKSREVDELSLPVHVVLIDCIDILDSEDLTDLLVDGSNVGVVSVVLDEYVTPEGATAKLSLSRLSPNATFVSATHPQTDSVHTFEVSGTRLATAARSMAGLRPAGSSRDVVGGSDTIRLVDLINAETSVAGVERVIGRWNEGGTTRIPVGGLGDLVIDVDIARDGPHGLVGGTTRSGKTEFLKSLITALAVSNHPNDLSIVIVDFKGGVDHELSAQLPHVIDLSTNHDVDSFVRTITLIEAELERRQREFRTVGAPNLDAYRAARLRDPSLLPIPRLLIIIDEFSELLSSETGKENLSSLESITRIGGGLGVHLLLVTQNFENQLPSQIAANAGMRICFRVQDASHSKAVLNSPEAATIPKEQIGRAILRSHGGRAIEFQAARVAGPRPGKESVTSVVSARLVPFRNLSDYPPQEKIADVPAVDTDMYAIMTVIREAATRSGWNGSVVPWPKDLPSDLSVGSYHGTEMPWPIGMLDEPELQCQSPTGLAPFGAHILFIGGSQARLGEILKAVATSGVIGRGPEEMHLYVIDLLGQGLSSLLAIPHTGGVAEQNEPLSMRILRTLAAEVGRRKTQLFELGFSSAQEMHTITGTGLPEVILIVNGVDRVLMHGEAQLSPILAPLLSLLSESVGTGVRMLLSGSPSVAHHRIGSAISHRFVFMCADPQEYSALGVPRALASGLNSFGRAIDVANGHLMQFVMIPSTSRVSSTEIVRAIGHRLTEKWNACEGSRQLPTKVRELPWPMPIEHVMHLAPPPEVRDPVAMSIDLETGEMSWLDAEEDGPVFVICGSSKSGRSNALIASAKLMAKRGWNVLGLPLSRRSPLAMGVFPGKVISVGEIKESANLTGPVALFLDDAHKWDGEVEGLEHFVTGRSASAVFAAGPTDFFSSRSDLSRILGRSRCALVLAPQSSMDASQFGVRRLNDEILRNARPGQGVLVVSAEMVEAQVPLAISP